MNKSSATEPEPIDAAINPRRFTFGDITESLTSGWYTFRAIPGPSIAFSAVFVVIGAVLLSVMGMFGVSPMVLPFAGGFMLVAPVLLTGFFRLVGLHERGRTVHLGDAITAFFNAPPSLWLVALVCAFLFIIWITDSAILYGVMVGGVHVGYDFSSMSSMKGDVVRFEVWGSLMGSVLAFIIFSVSAFSVPLLYEGRANLVQAIHASVRAVFRNFLSSLLWGIVLTGITATAILLLPLLLFVFPVLAYASFFLYRKVFPLEENATVRKVT